ncbi:MAG: type IV pilus assembly protein PilM [Holophagales bacterium]|jgi:type IV pilus assembly protein PilM|nr:type IV pilus assembly protein PilM [Holophagales bacterium]
MGFIPKKSKRLVGLDIGSSSVKVCELQRVGNKEGASFHLQKIGMAEMPRDSIVEGDIMDSNAVIATIRQAVSDQKIKAKEVAISVSGQQVIVKKVTLQIMSQAELVESIRWEAESFFPSGQSLDSYALDYAIVEERKAEGNMEVLLVACRKDKMESYISCVVQAGLKARMVDLDVFALQNVFEANMQATGYEEVSVLANIGASFTNLCMLTGKKSVFWRDIPFGGDKFTIKIAEDLGISSEGAEELKKGSPAEGREPQEAEPSIAAVSDSFADELSRNTEFFRNNFKVDKIDRILLSGGGAKMTSLAGVLKERFNVPVELLDPFSLIQDGNGVPGAEELGCAAAIVIGLAMREEGDR